MARKKKGKSSHVRLLNRKRLKNRVSSFLRCIGHLWESHPGPPRAPYVILNTGMDLKPLRVFQLLGLVLLLSSGFFLYRTIQAVDSTGPSLPRLYRAPAFSMVHVDGREITRDSLEGTVWIVNFIFTRCQGPCPLMTERFARLQDALSEKGLFSRPTPVRLVSITVDPGYDTPERLAEYARQWGADLNTWYFLRGTEEEIAEIIQHGFLMSHAMEQSTDQIIHGTHFLAVDTGGWIRGMLQWEDPDFVDHAVGWVRRLAAD